ncbi:Na+/H+ antiporter NhaA [Actinokineospora iranica]|uniref:Na(+)/H(+) antiporter NhaA n=1 Tax=Actinokineospora iranica TaxID=1271860 RepID=A0A1G6YG33_9PSEU|nr:Na+/H+ antiporter NhaA [Actinokineospora iranica]SDD89369.1 sodium/proton antiporter, NhaA family [Actinokineospora iranica]
MADDREAGSGLAQRVVDPLRRFVHDEAAGGVVLLMATVAALVWANSPAAAGYEGLWNFRLTVGAGPVAVTEDLRHWVNDGLMALFFFVVGLEIKRELVVGELRDRRAAALPALAALGGVLLPALLFLLVVGGGPEGRGWGIPLATDIAFAVGVLAVLGSRIPAGVKLFLLSVAIVDDIIAVGIIAVVYTDALDGGWLLAAAGALVVVAVMRWAGVASVAAYVPVGLFIWYATLHSGVHATIAGVVLGLMTPARPVDGRGVLDSLQHNLHPITAFTVVPLFALANAGVDLRGGALGDAVGSQVAWGVLVGLLVGKVVGIGGVTWLALRLRIGTLPTGMPMRLVWGVAALAGIGFTVSLFIADLAYTDPVLSTHAKVGIFAASAVAAALGSGLLIGLTRRSATAAPGPARTAE